VYDLPSDFVTYRTRADRTGGVWSHAVALKLAICLVSVFISSSVHTMTARKYFYAAKGPAVSTHIFRKVWSTVTNTGTPFI
jgi:hypothetical protein